MICSLFSITSLISQNQSARPSILLKRTWPSLILLASRQFVTENNPKYANRIIRQLKTFAKSRALGKSYDPYKAAYGSMPSHASANPEFKQLYINGHFCYVFKFGIITNGLGIIRHISFYNKDFLASHPEILVQKKSDSPDEDKSVHDSMLLIPTLKDFFIKHPLINPKTFLGDAAFDTMELYKALLSGNTFWRKTSFSESIHST